MDDVLLAGGNKATLEMIKGKLMGRFKMSDMGDVSRVLGMQVSRDSQAGSLTITQDDYTRGLLVKYGMQDCRPIGTPGYGKELFLVQPEERLLGDEAKRRLQAIVGSTMYLSRVTRYDISYAVNQLARAISKPSSQQGEQPGQREVNFIVHRDDVQRPRELQGGHARVNGSANCGSGACGRSTGDEEAVFCQNMMTELGFKEDFKSVPLHIDNTSALHVAGNQTYSSRAKHVALRYFYIREIIKEGNVSIRYIPTEKQRADLGTKFLDKQWHRVLIELIKNFQMSIEGRNIKHTIIIYLDRNEDIYIAWGCTSFTARFVCFVVRSTTRLLRTGGGQKRGSAAKLFVQELFCGITHTSILYGADRDVVGRQRLATYIS